MSSSKNVVYQSLQLIRNLIINTENQERLMKMNLSGRLVHIYKVFKGNSENTNILIPISMCFEELLKNKNNQHKLAKLRFIDIFLELLHSTDFDICYIASVCLSHISEIMESHDKLVERNIMNIMGLILKESKHAKMHR